MNFTSGITFCGLLASALLVPVFRGASAEKKVDFFRDVQPLLSEHCTSCHGGVKKKGGIVFTNRRDAFVEAESGSTPLVPGDLEKSELIYRIAAEDEDERMPPEEPLKPEQVAMLKRWVAEGAEWPVHWADETVAAVEAPEVRKEDWAASAIDKFVLARLEAEGIDPSPEAERRVLIRRLSLDLTGLLPTPEEVEAFVKDPGPDAYGAAVDRLLSSEHFGERWGRHWLDEARYADSEGYEKDSARLDSFRFRDWVIDAVNADMPFDEFTMKQVAGDLLPKATREDRVATAFHLMTQFNLEGGVDAEEDRTKRVIDQMSTVASAWLGSTIGCAQCHDHPYDPLTQREFYEFYAFFNNADYAPIFVGEFPEDAENRILERQKQWEPLAQLLEEQVGNKNLSVKVQAALTKMRTFDNSNGFTRVVAEREKNRRETYIFRRGDFLQPLKDEGAIEPGTPAAFPEMAVRDKPVVKPVAPPAAEDEEEEEKEEEAQVEKKAESKVEADRLDLARWLVDPGNPRTARVTVNKVWMHLLGKPLAALPQDFGARGEAPSHPELLDWLANFFVAEAKWSRKRLIREIVMSATYKQASNHRPELEELDPGNALLARQNRFRAEAEIVRDLCLQAGGLLTREVGGPSVYPPIPEDVAALSYANNFKWKNSEGSDRYRRGMYTFYKRTAPDPNLVTFDCPDASISNPMRETSNSPLQALALWQNEVFMEAAQAMARRLMEDGYANDSERLEAGFLVALGREPAPREKATLLGLLKEARIYYEKHPEEAEELAGGQQGEGSVPVELAAWVTTTRVLLNLDEFLTRA